MALIKCKECGHQISKNAETCPNCGAKNKKKTSVITWICAGMLGLAVLIWAFADHTPSAPTEPSAEMKSLQAKASTKRAISEILKDPDSAKFEFYNENCGTVNSKNSFGGYTGPKRFVSVDDIIDLEGHTISKKQMDKLWNKYCK